MSNWINISKNRVQQEKNGFVVIKPIEHNKPISLFCPVCTKQMKNAQDAFYYRKYEACFNCSTYYAEPNKDLWKLGWRPDLFKNA